MLLPRIPFRPDLDALPERLADTSALIRNDQQDPLVLDSPNCQGIIHDTLFGQDPGGWSFLGSAALATPVQLHLLGHSWRSIEQVLDWAATDQVRQERLRGFLRVCRYIETRDLAVMVAQRYPGPWLHWVRRYCPWEPGQGYPVYEALAELADRTPETLDKPIWYCQAGGLPVRLPFGAGHLVRPEDNAVTPTGKLGRPDPASDLAKYKAIVPTGPAVSHPVHYMPVNFDQYWQTGQCPDAPKRKNLTEQYPVEEYAAAWREEVEAAGYRAGTADPPLTDQARYHQPYEPLLLDQQEMARLYGLSAQVSKEYLRQTMGSPIALPETSDAFSQEHINDLKAKLFQWPVPVNQEVDESKPPTNPREVTARNVWDKTLADVSHRGLDDPWGQRLDGLGQLLAQQPDHRLYDTSGHQQWIITRFEQKGTVFGQDHYQVEFELCQHDPCQGDGTSGKGCGCCSVMAALLYDTGLGLRYCWWCREPNCSGHCKGVLALNASIPLCSPQELANQLAQRLNEELRQHRNIGAA